jgi:drug/metabolite transporter (DMT)-like permease
MRRADVARLIALAAIWGGSFMFVRITAPVIGPAATADWRMLVAGVALAVYFRIVGFDPQWRRHGGQYVLVGLMNSAAPFLLYAYAALELSAGLMAVLNATSPMFGALLSALFLSERLSARRVAGLALGIAGVALVSRPESGVGWMGIAAALGASLLYGLTGVYLRRFAKDVPSRGMAVGTQLSGGLLLLPLVAVLPPPEPVTAIVAANVLVLGLICGAVAYLLYFRLIADIGPTRALTVTYLIPIFGVLWGALFLGETLSVAMLAGAALVILGTILVLKN